MHAGTVTPRKASKTASLDGRTLFCDAPSYFGAAEGMCMLVRHFLRQHELPEIAFSTELVVRECLNNAINHGNRHDPRKRIRLFVVAEKKAVRLTVEDDGDGFNWKEYSTARLPGNTETAGRGLAVIASYARHFEFNRRGNVIRVEIGTKRGKRGKR